MAQVKEKLWTLEEFLAFDDGTDTSYQLFEGQIVTCTPGDYKDPFIAEPVLVVEVLSPTTSATDFSRKLPDHQQIPSMRDILLVSSMERLIRHWRREPDGWVEQAHRGSATLRLIGLPVGIPI